MEARQSSGRARLATATHHKLRQRTVHLHLLQLILRSTLAVEYSVAVRLESELGEWRERVGGRLLDQLESLTCLVFSLELRLQNYTAYPAESQKERREAELEPGLRARLGEATELLTRYTTRLATQTRNLHQQGTASNIADRTKLSGG